MSSLNFRTGPQANSIGSTPLARLTNFGNVATDGAHGRYFEENYRGNVFVSALQASTTFTLFGTTAATGNILSNVAGSGKNLIILSAAYAQVVAAAAAISQIVLSGAASATAMIHTTPIVLTSGVVGVIGTAVGKADSSATLPTAGLVIMPLWVTSVSATAALNAGPGCFVDIGGSVIVPPGAFAAIAAGYTNTMTGVATITWVELPI